MPNWCSNFVQITHEDPARISSLAEAVNAERFFDSVIPVPKALLEHPAPNEIEDELLARHGARSWYDFCVSRWGVKWDVGPYGSVEIIDGTHLSFGFDSAWSYPVGVYEELVKQGFTVDAMYYEPGMGFCGRWVNGDDDYYDISGMNSDEVAQTIDPDIDQQFAISENMSLWEQEAEES